MLRLQSLRSFAAERALVAALGVLAAALPTFLADGVMRSIAALGDRNLGYFSLAEPALLWVFAPTFTASASLLFLAPGLAMVAAVYRPRGLAETLVLALGASLLFSILFPGVTLALGLESRLAKLALWLFGAIAVWIAAARRPVRAAAADPSAQRRRALWLLGLHAGLVVSLSPKLFWEDFNLDGLEAFEFARSLSERAVPHWELSRGTFGFYSNFWVFAYPNAWFQLALGSGEWAVRLPFVLWTLGLFAGLLALIELCGERALGWREEAALLLGLVCACTVASMNATYEPFHTDVAEPGATDFLWVMCFLGCAFCLWSRRRSAFFAFGILSYGASAGGLLLLALLAVANRVLRPTERAETRDAVLLVASCVAIGLIHQLVLAPHVFGPVNDQFSGLNLLRRLFPPTLTEWVRLNALIFPSGILPAASLLWAWRGDSRTRVLAAVTIAYFGTIYVQVWTNLHQFTPVMILPLAVFWRRYTDAPHALQRALLPACAVAAVVAFVLSLPPHFLIDRRVRAVGVVTEIRVGDYQREYAAALRGATALASIAFDGDYRMQYPQQPFGVEAATWLYYASLAKPAGTTARYVVQEASTDPLPRAVRLGERGGLAVYTADLGAWERDRAVAFPRVCQSKLYEPIFARTYAFFRGFAARAPKTARTESGQSAPAAEAGGSDRAAAGGQDR